MLGSTKGSNGITLNCPAWERRKDEDSEQEGVQILDFLTALGLCGERSR